MPSRRQQPKRKVAEIVRTGSYPEVWWEHWLECGHLELRKRKSTAKQIACALCARATGIVVYDESAELADYEQKIEAKFASKHDLTLEQVRATAYMEGGRPKIADVVLSFHRSI